MTYFSLFFLLLTQWAWSLEIEFHKFQLENGMTVIFHPSDRTPMIDFQVWYRVGGNDEEVGKTGLAHLFEHLMFRGTEKFPKDRFQKIISENGISNNAYTTPLATVYYESLPKDKLELVFDLESDRMRNLKITEEDFKSELAIVKEERRLRVDNQPYGALIEKVHETVFKKHPMRFPVIGLMRDLNNATYSSALQFHQDHYGPNNAVLVISGDTDLATVTRLAKKYFGPIAPRGKTRITIERPKEPAQNGERLARVDKDLQFRMVTLAFQAPSLESTGVIEMDVIAKVLAGGESSRLHTKLVRELSLVSQVGAFFEGQPDTGLFVIYASMKKETNPSEVIKHIINELWSLRNNPISETELKRAKLSLKTDFTEQLVSLNGKGGKLGWSEMVYGDPRKVFSLPKLIDSVTVDSVKSVAASYLKPQQRSVVTLGPAQGGGSL